MVFTPLFTIFVLLIGGYFAKKVGVLKQKQSRTFLDFVIMFALPCLIFEKIYHLDLNFSLVVLILMGFGSCVLSAFLALGLGFILKFSRATLVSVFLLSCFGNTMFIGIPIVLSLFPNFIGELVLYDILATNFPIALFAPFILSFGAKQKVNLQTLIKKVLTFPPFLAVILALLCKNFALNELIFEPLRLFGNSATPVALFAIGLGLGFGAIRSSYKATLLVICAKMIIAPLLFMAFLKLFGFEFDTAVIVAIIECATPTMTLAAALIIKAKLDSNLAVSAVAFGILASFITLPLLLSFLL